MTAPQRVDPARIRQHVRARTVAKAADIVLTVLVLAFAVGMLAKLGVIADRWEVLAPIGGVGALLAFIVAGLADQLADRYRQPADNAEDKR